MKFQKDLLASQNLKAQDSVVYLYKCNNIFDGYFYMIEILNHTNIVEDIKSFNDLDKAKKAFINIISLDTKKYLINNYSIN